MKRYSFVTTFGQKEKEDGKWVLYEDIKSYIMYQNTLIRNLQNQVELLNEERKGKKSEETNPVA